MKPSKKAFAIPGLIKGSVTVLMSISHFPTMYYVKDLETGRTFTVPLHSVERMP